MTIENDLSCRNLILQSTIKPMPDNPDSKPIGEFISQKILQSDEVKIAVGYISQRSLSELDVLAQKASLKKVILIAGMYSQEVIYSSTYNLVKKLNSKWMTDEIGEIRYVKPFQYHGKIFLFYKDQEPVGAVIGSANLSVLKPDGYSRRMFETSCWVEGDAVSVLEKQFNDLMLPKCSVNAESADFLTVEPDPNLLLDGVELVQKVPENTVDFYKNHLTGTEFIFPIKVPAFKDRFLDDGKHFTKSNINVSYAAPRSKTKNRDWFETQMTVSTKIREKPGYPEYKKPFFVVTDDGYWFKAHTTSQGNKQFSAVGDELIVGRWLKGRLAAAGLVEPVNDTGADTERLGMITKEMLEAYGADALKFEKTDQKAVDPNAAPDENNELDVWMISMTKNPGESGEK